MTNTEKKKMYEDVAKKLNEICEKEENLVGNINDLVNGNFFNILVNNHLYEEDKIELSKKEVNDSKNNIKNNILPSVNKEIEELDALIKAEEAASATTTVSASNDYFVTQPSSSSTVTTTPTTVPQSSSSSSYSSGHSYSSSNG